jgi:predicted CoA-binding protein
MSEKNKTVVVLGASPKPGRYSNQAVAMLKDYGYEVIPVNPSGISIHDLSTRKSLDELKEPVDTLTMYVGAKISSGCKEAILQLKPKRVIFNPGTENLELEKALEVNGIEILHACTLVLLRTEQF